MIISHKLKYIYIHIPRTAGTSIKKILQNSIFEIDLHGYWKNASKKDYEKFKICRDLYIHANVSQVKSYIEKKGYDWDEYFKFAFIRNPWDQLVSNYKFETQKMFKNTKFLEKEIWCQSNYIFDKNGNCLIDFIGKFENLEFDLKNILKKINPSMSDDMFFLEKLNSTKRNNNYRLYYNEKTKKNVEEKCKKIIEMGKYEF